MALSTATVTAKVGPGNTETAAVLNNIRLFEFDCMQNNLRIVQNNGAVSFHDISLQGTYTLIYSTTTKVFTLTVA